MPVSTLVLAACTPEDVVLLGELGKPVIQFIPHSGTQFKEKLMFNMLSESTRSCGGPKLYDDIKQISCNTSP